MTEAFANGAAQPFERAVHDAARVLARARRPVISGELSDAGAVRAAVRLAEKCGGVFDHAASGETLRFVDTVRSGGTLAGAPEELRRIATHILAIGGAQAEGFGCPQTRLASRDDLPALRAEVTGRPHRSRNKALARIAAALKEASFVVVLWRQDELDAAETMMAMGLVRDLNEGGRASALPLGATAAADLASTWLTGFPARTSLARGFAEHDPWAFDARRLITSGEGDLLLWVEGEPPGWAAPSSLIVISGLRRTARLCFVTAPAKDGVYLNSGTGTLAQTGSGVSEASRVLGMILEAMP